MSQSILYKSVIEFFRQIAVSHQLVNEFRLGEDWDKVIEENQYPLLYLEVSEHKLLRKDLNMGFNEMTYNISLWCFDKVMKDGENREKVYSETLYILDTIVNHITQGQYAKELRIKIEGEPTSIKQGHKEVDDLNGWLMRFVLRVPSNFNLCNSPITPFDFSVPNDLGIDRFRLIGPQGFQGPGNSGESATGPQGPRGFQGLSTEGTTGSQGPTGQVGGYTWEYQSITTSTPTVQVEENTLYLLGGTTFDTITSMIGSTILIDGSNLEYTTYDIEAILNGGEFYMRIFSSTTGVSHWYTAEWFLGASDGWSVNCVYQSSTGGNVMDFEGNYCVSFILNTQGNQGPMGFQGLAGSSGEGSIGPQGLIGTQGFQGFQGRQGLIGTQGFQGFQGFQGRQGLIGFQGRQGFQGYQGPMGFQGVTGVDSALSQAWIVARSGQQPTQGAFNTGVRITWDEIGAGEVLYIHGDAYTGPFGPPFSSDFVDANQWFELYQGYFDSETQVIFNISQKGFPGNRATFILTEITFEGTWPNTWDITLSGPTTQTGPGMIEDGLFILNADTLSFNGAAGAQGFRGFQGIEGFQGWQGFQGFQGWQGPQGYQGLPGTYFLKEDINLLEGGWTFSTDVWEYTYTDVDISSTQSRVDFTPYRTTIDVVKTAEVLPWNFTDTGETTFYAENQPTGNILGQITIWNK